MGNGKQSITGRQALAIILMIASGLGLAASSTAKERGQARLAPAATVGETDDAAGRYTVRLDRPAQVIRGLGFEIQSDTLNGPRSNPKRVIGVPHDLLPAERQRFYKEMLKGFRYCRLALGLYLRGTDASGRHIQERYPNQMRDLLELQRESGIEGFAPEYWSPAPAWKSNNSFTGNYTTLKRWDDAFLNEFGDALVEDVRYLQSHGLKVVQWGLQNEPATWRDDYSKCYYTPEQYLKAFKIVAPKIRKAFPEVLIHATSWDGQWGNYGKLLAADPEARRYVDAWTWHRVGAPADNQVLKADIFGGNAQGKPVFNNEFEYLKGGTSDERFMNTAHSIVNWMVFENAPTWYWLHALKPTDDRTAAGFGLGFWRPPDDDNFTTHGTIRKGCWVTNPRNYNAIAGFLRHLPWDSWRLTVEEDRVRLANRIMAARTPAGRLLLVLTNRQLRPFLFHVRTGLDKPFQGFRYTPRERGTDAGRQAGGELAIILPAQSVEFWVEQ